MNSSEETEASKTGVPAREICKACYEVIRVGFTVPDDLWSAAVPEHLRQSTLCLNCFTRLADEHMLAWDKSIEFWPVSLRTHLRQEMPSCTAGRAGIESG